MARGKPIPLTAEGRANLEAELQQLVQVQRPAIVARVASTRNEGDLSENFGYHDARRELGMLDGRVQTIEAILRDAVVITELPSDGTVRLGSRVKVRDEFGESDYTIVGATEADVARGLISHESPLGSALAGKAAGDSVSFASPGGERRVTIVDVG
jgi:transcription elongation factor GreA